MKKSDPPIIVEATYDAPILKVWKAITDKDQMKIWFFEQIHSFEAKVGFNTDFIVQVEDKIFTHEWEILEVSAPNRIKYNWRYKEYDGDSNVIFNLREQNDKTTLRLTTEIIQDFPSEIAEFSRESCLGGWRYFLQDQLNHYLSQ